MKLDYKIIGSFGSPSPNFRHGTYHAQNGVAPPRQQASAQPVAGMLWTLRAFVLAFDVLTQRPLQEGTPVLRAPSPLPLSTSPNYTPESSPIFTIHPGPKRPIMETRELARQKTHVRAEAMRQQLGDRMHKDGYERFYREAACECLHLWYGLYVIAEAFPRGTPSQLDELVDQMRQDVERATRESVMKKFEEAMETANKPLTFPDHVYDGTMQKNMERWTAEIARSVAIVDLNQHMEILAALNADMNKDGMPDAEKRAATLLLPVYYAMYTMQSSFANGQPHNILYRAQAISDSVDCTLVKTIYVENIAGGADVANCLPSTSYVRATQMYCTDAVCVVLAETAGGAV